MPSVTRPPVRLRLPVDEYYRMYELGLIDVQDFEKSEIIDGELVRKMSIGDKHAWLVNFLNRFFSRHMPESVLVSVQNPLRLGDYDEPEPDIVLADLTKYDGRRHPTPEETLLVIEVAETSLRIDRSTKLPLYASNKIPEFWIVNIPDQIVEVYTNPEFGMYRTTEIFKAGDMIKSALLDGLSLLVDELLS